MGLIDVIDDDGGDGHDLSWPRGHDSHDEHSENQEGAKYSHFCLGHENGDQACWKIKKSCSNDYLHYSRLT